MVVFDIAGTMFDVSEGARWALEGVPATPYPGTVEVVSAYRERGYEILYVTTLPITTFVDGSPLAEAIATWLGAEGFPSGDGTHVWIWDGRGENGVSWTSVTDELLRLAGEGVSVDVGYTENPDKAYAYATAGVPSDRIFTFESLPIDTPSNPLPGDDFAAHLPTVQALPPVCQIG